MYSNYMWCTIDELNMKIKIQNLLRPLTPLIKRTMSFKNNCFHNLFKFWMLKKLLQPNV